MKRPKNFFRSFKQKIKRCFPCINIEVVDEPSAPKRRQPALKSGSEDVSVNRQQPESPPHAAAVPFPACGVQILETEAIPVPASPLDKILTVPAPPENLEIPSVQFPISEVNEVVELPSVQFLTSAVDEVLEIPSVQFPKSEVDGVVELPSVQFPTSEVNEVGDEIPEIPAVAFPASELDEIQKKEDQLAEIEQVLKQGKAIKKSQVSNLAFPEMLGLLNGLLDSFNLKCENDSEGSTSSELLPIIFTNTSKYDLNSNFLMFDEKYGAKYNKKGFANALQGRTVLMRSVKKWEGNYFGPGEGIIQIEGRAGNREKQKGGLSVIIIEEGSEMLALIELRSLKPSFPNHFTIYCNRKSFDILLSLMSTVPNYFNLFQFEKAHPEELDQRIKSEINQPIRLSGPGAMFDNEGANDTDGNLCGTKTGLNDLAKAGGLMVTAYDRTLRATDLKDQGCKIFQSGLHPDLLSSFGSNKALYASTFQYQGYKSQDDTDLSNSPCLKEVKAVNVISTPINKPLTKLTPSESIENPSKSEMNKPLLYIRENEISAGSSENMMMNHNDDAEYISVVDDMGEKIAPIYGVFSFSTNKMNTFSAQAKQQVRRRTDATGSILPVQNRFLILAVLFLFQKNFHSIFFILQDRLASCAGYLSFISIGLFFILQ